MTAATRGQVVVEYACRCGQRRLVRSDRARTVLVCFSCKHWARQTGRRGALEAGGALPAELAAEATR